MKDISNLPLETQAWIWVSSIILRSPTEFGVPLCSLLSESCFLWPFSQFQVAPGSWPNASTLVEPWIWMENVALFNLADWKFLAGRGESWPHGTQGPRLLLPRRANLNVAGSELLSTVIPILLLFLRNKNLCHVPLWDKFTWYLLCPLMKACVCSYQHLRRCLCSESFPGLTTTDGHFPRVI
jgi:hypothetical protein